MAMWTLFKKVNPFLEYDLVIFIETSFDLSLTFYVVFVIDYSDFFFCIDLIALHVYYKKHLYKNQTLVF